MDCSAPRQSQKSDWKASTPSNTKKRNTNPLSGLLPRKIEAARDERGLSCIKLSRSQSPFTSYKEILAGIWNDQTCECDDQPDEFGYPYELSDDRIAAYHSHADLSAHDLSSVAWVHNSCAAYAAQYSMDLPHYFEHRTVYRLLSHAPKMPFPLLDGLPSGWVQIRESQDTNSCKRKPGQYETLQPHPSLYETHKRKLIENISLRQDSLLCSLYSRFLYKMRSKVSRPSAKKLDRTSPPHGLPGKLSKDSCLKWIRFARNHVANLRQTRSRPKRPGRSALEKDHFLDGEWSNYMDKRDK